MSYAMENTKSNANLQPVSLYVGLFAGIVWVFGLGSLVAIGLGVINLRNGVASRSRAYRILAVAAIVIGLVGLVLSGFGFWVSTNFVAKP